MTVFDRKFLKEEFPDLIKHIQAHHIMEPLVNDELFINNPPVKGLTHTRGYFAILLGDIFIQYEMQYTILNPELALVGRTVNQAIIYDNYQEYESARIMAMNRVAPKDQTGINFN